MAAEAFAGLSIAANIAQFTEYALALISDCRDIYDSSAGAKQENLEIEAVIRSITERHAAMRSACSGASAAQVSGRRQAATVPPNIMRLVDACEPSVKSLMEVLQKLKANKKSRFPKLESLRAAVVASLSSSTIRRFKERLLTIESELSREMLRALTNGQSDISRLLQKLQDDYAEQGLASHDKLDRLKKDVLENADKISRELAENKYGFSTLVSKIEQMTSEAEAAEHETRVLQSLKFPEISDREDMIKPASECSLTWLYENGETGFYKWLESADGIYWVLGKAGSGKSTLMKYVNRDDRTLHALRAWSGERQLVMVRFYFWNPGTLIQKSQQGLLRSLLFQILSTCRSLIPKICPNSSVPEWPLEQLKAAISQITAQTELQVKFCFLIDGLDEYSGDVEDITQAILQLSRSPHIKICVSSRPWANIAESLDPVAQKLVLHEFTEPDMVAYAKFELSRKAEFLALTEIDSRFAELPCMIASKAQGVWLWTFLVVRNIRSELTTRTTFEAVSRKLESLPGELETFFERILANLRPSDRAEADKILLLSLEAVLPLPLPALHWIGECETDSSFAIGSETRPMLEQEIEILHEEWRVLLSNRCGDLLEINRKQTNPRVSLLGHYRVEFLHRTVHEFLTHSYANKLRQRVPPEFKCLHVLARIMIVTMKRSEPKLSIDLRFPFVTEFLYYARKADRLNEAIDADLIDELQRILNCSRFWRLYWKEERLRYSFLPIAIQSGLSSYVALKLTENPNLHRWVAGRPLLDFVLRPYPHISSFTETGFVSEKVEWKVDTRIAELILRRLSGSNTDLSARSALVNETFRPDGRETYGPAFMKFIPRAMVLSALSSRIKLPSCITAPLYRSAMFEPTPWTMFLSYCCSTEPGPATVSQCWYQATELLIENGADPHTRFAWGREGETVTVAQLLSLIFPQHQANRLVLKLTEAHRRRCQTSWPYWFLWGFGQDVWENEQLRACNQARGDVGSPEIMGIPYSPPGKSSLLGRSKAAWFSSKRWWRWSIVMAPGMTRAYLVPFVRRWQRLLIVMVLGLLGAYVLSHFQASTR